jgi:ABC-type dipeptide/oligopeptide/nickel transport system permease component
MQGFFGRNGWWIVRVGALPMQILVFTILVFLMVRAIPGDPIEIVTGGQYTPEVYATIQHAMGLDGTMTEQLQRYLIKVAQLDLGESLISGRSILEDLVLKLPATFELALLALIGVLALTFFGSYLAVIYPSNWVSRGLMAYVRTAGAIPEFALGVAAIFFFYATLHWAPAPLGRLSPFIDAPPAITHMPLVDALLSGDGSTIRSMLAHLALPIWVMVIAHAPVLMKLLIADLEAAIDAPPTRFRIASGAGRLTVMLSLYRRALPPTVTMIGNMFGHLLGGAITIEILFGFDGMGKFALDALMSADLAVMQSLMLVVAVISLVVYLLVDLVNMLLDPRRRPGKRVDG